MHVLFSAVRYRDLQRRTTGTNSAQGDFATVAEAHLRLAVLFLITEYDRRLL